MMNTKIVKLICLILCLQSVALKSEAYKITHPISFRSVERLPSPYPVVTAQELNTPWGQELFLGISFAKDGDLYRALTCFKREKKLLNLISSENQRIKQAEYSIILSYFLGGKFNNVIETFESSELQNETSQFPAYNQLLVILYDSYLKRGEIQKADNARRLLSEQSTEKALKLDAYKNIIEGKLENLSSSDPTLYQFATEYKNLKKSPSKAMLYNALLPGAGYYYVGEKQTAVTSFLLNALFIGATWQFFEHGQWAAGVISAGFECGWYFGGIYGAKHSAERFNEIHYARLAKDVMAKEKLFPILMLDYGF